MSAHIKHIPAKIHMLITIILMFGIGFIPPVSLLTETGMKILGVLIGAIYGVTFCTPAWPCMLAMVAMAALGVAPVATILSAGIGSDSIMLMIFFFVFVAVLENNRITEFLATWLISRKFIKGRPWLFSYFLIVGTMFTGAISSDFPAMIIFWGILASTCKMYDIKPFTKYPTVMFIGITLGGLGSSATWLFRGNPLFVNALLKQISENTMSLNFGLYALFNVTLWLAAFAGYILMCKYLLRIDLGTMAHIDDSVVDKNNLNLDKRQKVLLAYVALTVIVYCGIGFTPTQSTLGQYFSGFGNTLPIVFILTLMAVTVIEGKPLLQFQDAASKGVVWDTIVLSAALLSISTIMMSSDTGVAESILSVLGPVFEGHGAIFMCIVIFVVAAVLTNFMANTTVGLMFTPVIYSFALEMGFDPIPLISMLLISIHIAFITPAASPYASLMFGNSNWVKSGDLYRYGVLTFICLIVIFLVLGIPLSNVLF